MFPCFSHQHLITIVPTRVLLLVALFVTIATCSECIKTSPCSCDTARGKIDLHPLAANGTARFKDIPDSLGMYMYSWNPCSSFSESGDCVNAAVCQIVRDRSHSYLLGTQESVQFISSDTGAVEIQYIGEGSDRLVRKTTITLVCDLTAEGVLDIIGEITLLNYSMRLTSKYACIHN